MIGVETLDGWFVLHDFRRIDWHRISSLNESEKSAVIQEAQALFDRWHQVDEARKGSFGIFSIAGTRADVMMLNLRETVDELIELKREFDKTRLATYTTPEYSYVSVVELSNYVVNRDVDATQDPAVMARLKPALPAMSHVCFYPMNKKRDGQDNWYMQPLEERRRMMHEHGMHGRSFAGKVVQMISGSIGFDDWEWGVTLFANDPLIFKKVVYDMRFDEVSARFGEFGRFYVGKKLKVAEFLQAF